MIITDNSIHHAEFMDLCAAMPDASVDLILCDLPYGNSRNKWDAIIPIDPMWAAFKRIMKPKAAIVLTCTQPFTSMLVSSNLKMFREELIWDKVMAVGFLNANRKHLKQHETILIFGHGLLTYNPQMSKGVPYKRPPKKQTPNYGAFKEFASHNPTGDRYPKSIVQISNGDRSKTVHPTQKPISLFSYLIRTYSNPGEMIFDPCVGSGTTALAARTEGRKFIVGDSNAEYIDIARKRLEAQ